MISRPARLVVAVLDSKASIKGDCLSVLGRDSLVEVPSEMARSIPSDLDRCSQRRNVYVGWDSAIATSLTPAHFRHSSATTGGRLDARLDCLIAGLSTMCLCDRPVSLGPLPPQKILVETLKQFKVTSRNMKDLKVILYH